jgi:hypothetical protein
MTQMKLYSKTLYFLTLLVSISSFSQEISETKSKDTLSKKVIFPILNNNFSKKLQIAIIASPISDKILVSKFVKPPSPYWSKKNVVGFDISEIAFVNWSAGGTSSISGLFKGDFNRTYQKGNRKWVNELIVRYGMNKQDGIEVRKTDDAVHLNSTFGYRNNKSSNWYHTAKFNFNTQFTNGYKYPNRDVPKSRAFAPAYMFVGVGAENSNKAKDRVFYISPFTYKTTLVLDQTLANQGAFGVVKATYDADGNIITKGKNSKNELGFLITNYYKKEIYKNVNFVNRLNLYSDYVNNFGNVDVDCDLLLNLVVNQYVKANIGTRIIYDDDIKNKTEIAGVQVTEGPKAQLKQVLGVGITYAF